MNLLSSEHSADLSPDRPRVYHLLLTPPCLSEELNFPPSFPPLLDRFAGLAPIEIPVESFLYSPRACAAHSMPFPCVKDASPLCGTCPHSTVDPHGRSSSHFQLRGSTPSSPARCDNRFPNVL